ncbi:hypothetical protein DYH09_12960 [bacterium CPR1]|nr:hypothetical protein [bacterium CPR1]
MKVEPLCPPGYRPVPLAARPLLPAHRPASPVAPLPSETADACPSLFGAIGALAAGVTGRILPPALLATAGATVGSTLAGLVGGGLGALAGLYAGYRLEKRTRLGRLVGGMAGGLLGAGLGHLARGAGVQPSLELARETAGFSLRSLPARLLDPNYTSHPKISPAVAAQGASHCQPGDLVITNDDGDFSLELAQKAVGVSAHWTHVGIVDHNHRVMDILLTENTARSWPLEFIFTDNTHAKVLRPAYQDDAARDRTLDWARAKLGKVTYDWKFDLESDDALYCQEYIQKALKQGGILIEPRKVLLFKDFVSADEFGSSPQLTEVWSTGSNFWLNWLSKVT